jgi:hypothetical protein
MRVPATDAHVAQLKTGDGYRETIQGRYDGHAPLECLSTASYSALVGGVRTRQQRQIMITINLEVRGVLCWKA